LEVIKEMTGRALAETETLIVIGYLERNLTGIQLRDRQGSSVLPQPAVDWMEMLKTLLTLKCHHNTSTCAGHIPRELKQRFFQTVGEVFAYRFQFLQEKAALFLPVMQKLFDFDRGTVFEGFLSHRTTVRKQMRPSWPVASRVSGGQQD
jgi:hypothetical protein